MTQQGKAMNHEAHNMMQPHTVFAKSLLLNSLLLMSLEITAWRV
jgi:hypothetical protein